MEPIRNPSPEYDTTYFASRIEDIASEMLPEGVTLGKGIEVGANLLQLTHERYSENPYHNADHPLNVLRRHWKLMSIIQSILPDKIDNSMYDLSIAPVCGHDVINEPGAPAGENEEKSAEVVYQYMLEADYSEEEAQIGYDMVIGTAVTRNKKGVIVQNNLRKGLQHPLVWVLANADINGIAMEGVPRMVSDALDLYLEFSGTSVKDFLHNPAGATAGAADFFQTQAQFLSDRLAAVDEDLSYYFTEKEKQMLQEAFDEEFTGTTRDAVSAARVLFRFPKMPELIIHSATSGVEDIAGSGAEQLAKVKKHAADLLKRSHDRS